MAMTKITLSIPENLKRRAKAATALRTETISDVLRRALEEYVADAQEELEDLRVVDEFEAREKRGEVKWYSHDEVWSEIEDLEARGELPS